MVEKLTCQQLLRPLHKIKISIMMYKYPWHSEGPAQYAGGESAAHSSASCTASEMQGF